MSPRSRVTVSILRCPCIRALASVGASGRGPTQGHGVGGTGEQPRGPEEDRMGKRLYFPRSSGNLSKLEVARSRV